MMLASAQAETAKRARLEYRAGVRAWYMVGVLVSASVLSYVDRQILALMVQPVRHDLRITDTEFSIVQGFAFTILYSVIGLPLGRYVDRRGRRNLIAIGILLWSLMTIGCGLVHTYQQLFLMRIGVGIGEATLAPAAYAMIADAFPPARRGTALGVYTSAIYLGIGAAVVIGGSVLVLIRDRAEIALPLFGVVRSWQAAFIGVGLPGLVVAPLTLTLREPGRVLPAPAGEAPRGMISYAWRHRTTFVPQYLGYALFAFAAYGLGTWMQTFFIRTYHWAPAVAAIRYGTAVCIFGTAGGVLGGIAADKWIASGRADARIRLSMLAAIAWVPVIALGSRAGDGWTALAWFGPASFLSSIINCVGPTTVHDVVPSALRGRATALFFFVINLVGLGLGPTAVALVTDRIFHDDTALRWSIPIAVIPAIAMGTLLVAIARRPYAALACSGSPKNALLALPE